MTLQADWYPQPEHGGFYTALVKGYYRDEGLDLDIQPGGPMFPWLSRCLRVWRSLEWAPPTGAGRYFERAADGGRGGDDAARSARDYGAEGFAGPFVCGPERTHGGGETGSTWWEFVAKRYRLNDVHVVPAMMNVANFVADPNYIQQAFATSEPFFARKAGVETRVILTSDAGYEPYRVMFTTRDFLAQHPEIVGKFVRASLRGWREYLNDPAAAHAAIAKLNPALNAEWMQFTLAGFARWALCGGGGSGWGAAWADGSEALGDYVSATAGVEGYREDV